jgi:hypothetical protein
MVRIYIEHHTPRANQWCMSFALSSGDYSSIQLAKIRSLVEGGVTLRRVDHTKLEVVYQAATHPGPARSVLHALQQWRPEATFFTYSKRVRDALGDSVTLI